jgi:two-component system response regulator (stage 0 sporulation protein A)
MKTRLVAAEDNESIRKQLSEYFKDDGDFELVGTAKDGLEAISMIEALRPEVVLLDLILPELDGFGVMEGLRTLNIKKPKIIILSAISADSFVSKAIRSGADYYMVKPYDPVKLRNRMVETVGCDRDWFLQSNSRMGESYDFSGGLRGRRTLEEKITGIFITVGIPAHIKGYQFLREAIKLTVDTPEIINSITKKLYPQIAEKFETSASKVERAIRHAIEVAWNRGKIENINQLFGVRVYTNNEKPTNGEFIALVADKMLIEGA